MSENDMKGRIAEWRDKQAQTVKELRESGVEINPEELSDEQVSQRLLLSDAILGILEPDGDDLEAKKAAFEARKAGGQK